MVELIECACGCGQLRPRYDRRGRERKFINGHPNPLKRGDKIAWKGGQFVNDEGYVMVYKPDHPMAYTNGYALEHRLVMAEKLGKMLESHEIVHHKNEDRIDNRKENLTLTSSSGHRGMHEHSRGYSEAEKNIIRETYLTVSQDKILLKLPNRTWLGIKQKANAMRLSRPKGPFPRGGTRV